jgi:hypothetical protein
MSRKLVRDLWSWRSNESLCQYTGLCIILFLLLLLFFFHPHQGSEFNILCCIHTSTGPSTGASSLPDIPETVGSYNYVECHSDNTTIGTLQDKSVGSTDMTIEYCMGNCTEYQYFGVEYGAECYCGNSLTFGNYQATDGRRSMPCGVNANEICGGWRD